MAYQRSSAAIRLPLGEFKQLDPTRAVLMHTLKGYPLVPELIKETTYSDIAPLAEEFLRYGETDYVHQLPTMNLDTQFITQGISEDANTLLGYKPYPMAQIRVNKTDVINTGYKDSTAGLLDTINLPLEGITSSVNESPDIATIDDAFVGFAANLVTDSQAELEYLYEFFLDLMPKVTALQTKVGAVNPQTGEAKDIYLNILEGEYKVAISCTGITASNSLGSIGQIGTFTSEFKVDSVTEHLDRMNTVNGHMTITKQVSEDTISVITITNPIHHSYIHSKTARTIIDIQDCVTYKELLDQYALDDTPEDERENTHGFYIPLISDLVPQAIKGELFNSTLSLIINSYYEQKLKWYQTSIFRTIMSGFLIVVAAVLSYFQLYAVATELIGWGFGTLAAWSVAVFITVVVPYAVSTYVAEALAEYAVEHPEAVGAILAITAIVSTMTGQSATLGSFITQQLNSFTASVTLSAYNTGAQNKLEDLQAEDAANTAEYEEKLEELAALEEASFGGINAHDLASILEYTSVEELHNQPRFILETPDSFYGRTIHLGNPVDIEYSGVSDFVGRALTLPTLGNEHTLIY